MDAFLARARQTLRFATLTALVATAGCGDAQEAGAQGLARVGASGLTPPDGTYDLAFQGQQLPLVLTTAADGRVVGGVFGPSITFSLEGIRAVDEDEMSIEGVMVGGGTAAEFSLFPDEDGDFGFLLTPLGSDGAPQTQAAAFYYATYRSPDVGRLAAGGAGSGSSGMGAVGDQSGAVHGSQGLGTAAGSQAGGAPSTAGHPLVGTWATQVMMSSDMGTISTQIFWEFRPDGIMVDLGSRMLGTVGLANPEIGMGGGGDRVAWRTEGNMLLVSPDGANWVPLARFQLDGTRLGLTYFEDGSSQIWHRQGS